MVYEWWTEAHHSILTNPWGLYSHSFSVETLALGNQLYQTINLLTANRQSLTVSSYTSLGEPS